MGTVRERAITRVTDSSPETPEPESGLWKWVQTPRHRGRWIQTVCVWGGAKS